MKLMIFFFSVIPFFAHASVCEDLKSITDQTSSGFANLKGNYDDDLSEFSATENLPGARYCVIDDDDEFPVYSCSWELSNENEMLSSYRSLVNEISGCSNLFSQKPKVRVMKSQGGSSKYFEYRNQESAWIEALNTDFRIKLGTRTKINRRDNQETHLISVAVERK